MRLLRVGPAEAGRPAVLVDATARAVSPTRRSMLLGVVGAFSSVGTLVIAPLLQFMLERWDWRVGVALFVGLALAMIPAALMAGAVDRLPPPAAKRAGRGEGIGLARAHRRLQGQSDLVVIVNGAGRQGGKEASHQRARRGDGAINRGPFHQTADDTQILLRRRELVHAVTLYCKVQTRANVFFTCRFFRRRTGI